MNVLYGRNDVEMHVCEQAIRAFVAPSCRGSLRWACWGFWRALSPILLAPPQLLRPLPCGAACVLRTAQAAAALLPELACWQKRCSFPSTSRLLIL